MSRVNPRLLSATAVAAVLTVLLIGLADGFRDRIEPGLQALPTPPTASAVAAEILETPLYEIVAASIEARQATVISSRLLARIAAIHIRAGDSVSAGQLLVELEQGDLQARVQQSREKLRGGKARLREASQTLERMRTLQARKLVAAAEVDRAQAAHDALAAELSGARQALREAKTALAFSEIRSPIDGRVVDRFAEPGDTATPGARLLTIYNPLSLRVEAQVREQLALQLHEGQALEVEVPSLAQVVPAEIEERVPAAEPGSRSFLVKVLVPYDPRFLPGMYARLRVPAGQARRLLIPADHIIRLGQLQLVWVLVDGRPQRRFIRTGATLPPDRIEVLSGLEAGDRVTTAPRPG